MEKVDHMSHEEDIEARDKRPSEKRVSVQHGAGDRALDYIGDERVELTDEDVSLVVHVLAVSISLIQDSRTSAFAAKRTESYSLFSSGYISCRYWTRVSWATVPSSAYRKIPTSPAMSTPSWALLHLLLNWRGNLSPPSSSSRSPIES